MSLKKVTALDARKNLGTIMNAVSLRNDNYIVERKGKPMVAIIPIKKLEQMNRARQRFFKNMCRISKSFEGVETKVLDGIIEEATQAAKRND